ncbi:hypothetical protein BGZ46_004032 [Entomortierella lignicola]|nr:hypothetical protein BGZ46_004032 [Entomortierella lignicola]
MSVRMDKTQAIVQHILRHLSSPRRSPLGIEYASSKPLFVGISGPQGIGKTTLTNNLVSALSREPHNLRVLSFSMDDLYLTNKEQAALSQKYPDNKLIEFRGLPGTHDINLGSLTFRAFCEANQEAQQGKQGVSTKVAIPTYDKSLLSGRGDRIPQDQWPQADAPFDVILFEGWSLGFKSIRDATQLSEIYQRHSTFPPYYLANHPLSSLEMVNKSLEAYEREWYSYLDIFVHLSTSSLSTIFEWRAEQERYLWAKRGTGMTESQVREFVSRYMPAYEVYLSRLQRENVFRDDSKAILPKATFEGRHLRLDLDEDRNLVSTTIVD